jgi:hypothetical protein
VGRTILDQLPPIAARNASDSGTDVVRYLTESQGLSPDNDPHPALETRA